MQSKALPYLPYAVPNKGMLTGTELGAALKVAIEKKGVTKVAVAAHFGVKPPSVQDWINFGRIGKRHLNELASYFSDVVPLSHWGMRDFSDERFTAGAGDSEGHASTNPSERIKDVKTSLIDRSKNLADQIVGATRTGLLDESGLIQLEQNMRAYVAAAGGAATERGKGSDLRALPGEVKNERRRSGGKSR